MLLSLLLPLLNPSIFTFAQNNTDAQNATTFALIYGYPLLAWQRYASDVIDHVGINAFRHARELSTPANRSVVKPNVDTLYSTVIYDLSDTNLAISVPDVPADSFKLFSFYDPYGVNWANVGTGDFFRNGSYLLRNSAGGAGLQITNGSDYVAGLNAPSPYGTLLVRWGVNATNEDVVHGYQDATAVEEVKQSDDVFTLEMPPSLESLIEAYSASATPAENVLALMARYEESNTGLAGQLRAAGISDGEYEAQDSVNLTLANSTAVAQVVEAATSVQNIQTLNQGWALIDPSLIGVYDSNYALRAAVASSGYLALRYPFAVYPNRRGSSSSNASGAFDLGPDETLLVTFSGKPPLQQAGFWSLTAYGEDNFLIPNNISTYALGDRSNITYPDGSPIYGPDADEDQDRTFQILLQPTDVVPPSNWTSNWLPAPAGGGAVVPQLRFFAAQEEVIGNYEYPTVTRMAALTEDGSSGDGNGTASGTGGGSDTGSSPSRTVSGGSGSTSASASAEPNGAVVTRTGSWSAVLLFGVLATFVLML